jgi:perosamine synthetase
MIVTDDPEWDDLFRSMRNQGRGSKWLQHPRIGFNYRLNEMSAALGVSQLRRIETLLAKRADVAHRYNQALNGIAGIAPLRIAPTTTKMSWFVYVLRLAPAVDREKVMAALLEDGIPSRPYFAALHLQPPYRARYGYKEGDFPVTESVSASVLALPFHANMTDEHIEMVRDGLIRAIRLARR